MSAGYITSREQAKGRQTKQAKVNAAIGSASPDSIAAYRKARNGSRRPTFTPIPAERALVVVEQPEETPAPATVTNVTVNSGSYSEIPNNSIQRRLITHALHQRHLNNPPMHVDAAAQNTRRLMAARRPAPAPSTAAIKLFPPARIVNTLSAYEQFRNLPRHLAEAQRLEQIARAEALVAEIEAYANANQGGVVWFRVNAFGSRVDIRHFVYDPDTNRLERYWEGKQS